METFEGYESLYEQHEDDYFNGVTIESSSVPHGSTTYIKEEENMNMTDGYYYDPAQQGFEGYDSQYVKQENDYINGITIESPTVPHVANTYMKEEGNVEIQDELIQNSAQPGQMIPGIHDLGLVAAEEEVETMYDGSWSDQLQQGGQMEMKFANGKKFLPIKYEMAPPVEGQSADDLNFNKPRSTMIKMLKVPKMLKIPRVLKLTNYPMLSTLSVAHCQNQARPLETVAHLMRVETPSGNGKLVRVWQCGVCRREFFNRYTLVRHMPTHTDERHFMCDTCGKAFRQASTLAQHRAIHSNARPYVCPQCQKSFNRASSLISHKKTHAAVKQHVCKFCGKGFHQKGNLRNHEFTHTDARPYVCDFCGKGFNQRSNLVCHKDRLHKIERA